MSSPKPDDLEAVRAIAAALEPFDAHERERIIRWVKERLGMVAAQPPPPHPIPPTPQPMNGTAAPAAADGVAQPRPDIRSFVTEKAPKTDLQLIPVLGYFYRFIAGGEEHKDSISADDVKDACRKAGRAIPKRTDQTLVNACAAGYMDRAERGRYAINTVGENLVATVLPGGAEPEKAKKKRAPPRAQPRSRKSR
jgi:hypothetical protein